MRNKAFSKILILIILIILIGGGYFGWQYFWVSEETKDETANWKTYRNEEYGFEVKYPLDWKIDIYEYGVGAEFTPVNKVKPEEIFISVIASTQRPKDWSLGEWLAQIPGEQCDSEKVSNDLKWCEIATYQFEAVRQDSYGITKDDTDYIINFNVSHGRQRMDYYLSDEELSEEINTLNQILSTFRFIEIKDETADWKTYRSEEYGYEVKYPPKIEVKDEDKNFIGFLLEGVEDTSSTYSPIYISTHSNPEKLSVEQWLEEKQKSGFYPFAREKESIFVAESEGVKFNHKISVEAPDLGIVLIGRGELIYRIDTYRGFDSVFNQMLSTFRFIEVEDETANWKTYRNEEYGFEVKYPFNWKIVVGNNYFGFDEKDRDIGFGLGLVAPVITISLYPNEDIENHWIWKDIQGESPNVRMIQKEVISIKDREIVKALLESNIQELFYVIDSPKIQGFITFVVHRLPERDFTGNSYIAETMISTLRFLD